MRGVDACMATCKLVIVLPWLPSTREEPGSWVVYWDVELGPLLDSRVRTTFFTLTRCRGLTLFSFLRSEERWVRSGDVAWFRSLVPLVITCSLGRPDRYISPALYSANYCAPPELVGIDGNPAEV